MKTKLRTLADYIASFGCFACCGVLVLPDGSNSYISREVRRSGKRCWRVRCLACWRSSAATAMAAKRREAKAAARRELRRR